MKIDEILRRVFGHGAIEISEGNSIKAAKKAIQQLILEKMPEKKTVIEDGSQVYSIGFNTALADVTKVINDLFDGRE